MTGGGCNSGGRDQLISAFATTAVHERRSLPAAEVGMALRAIQARLRRRVAGFPLVEKRSSPPPRTARRSVPTFPVRSLGRSVGHTFVTPLCAKSAGTNQEFLDNGASREAEGEPHAGGD